VGGPLAEILTGAEGLVHGSPALLTGNQAGPFVLPAGETFSMTLTIGGEAPQSVAILGTGAAVTAADIATEIDGLEGLSALVDPNGFVQVTSDRTGEDITLKID